MVKRFKQQRGGSMLTNYEKETRNSEFTDPFLQNQSQGFAIARGRANNTAMGIYRTRDESKPILAGEQRPKSTMDFQF